MSTHCNSLSAPAIDNWLDRIRHSSLHTGKQASGTVIEKLHKGFNLLQIIKPELNNNEKVWRIWLRAKRGSIEEFGDYEELKEEGAIESLDTFEAWWKAEYPNVVKWYQISIIHKGEDLIFDINCQAQFSIDLNFRKIFGLQLEREDMENFIEWFAEGLKNEIRRFEQDPDAYNTFIEESLPFRKRYGRIKRRILWENIDGMDRFDEQLSSEILETFSKLVRSLDTPRINKTLTADEYFKFCEICYDANDYFKNADDHKTARDKYIIMADGRDKGLRDIPGESPEAFEQWYQDDARRGGHPWEISRGGNSTHISLDVIQKNGGWQLLLAGSSRIRVVETVKMAVALHTKDAPFDLRDKEAIDLMVNGKDIIGIVPDNVSPKYCHSDFPEQDNIIDFINPWYDPEMASVVRKKAEWYPLSKLSSN